MEREGERERRRRETEKGLRSEGEGEGEVGRTRKVFLLFPSAATLPPARILSNQFRSGTLT
jgi:hypothetical protein